MFCKITCLAVNKSTLRVDCAFFFFNFLRCNFSQWILDCSVFCIELILMQQMHQVTNLCVTKTLESECIAQARVSKVLVSIPLMLIIIIMQ